MSGISKVASSITDLARSGFWDYRGPAAGLSIGIPLAVEGIVLGKTIYEKPRCIQQKWVEFKDLMVRSFTIQKGNRNNEIRKIIKNVFQVALCVGLMATSAYLAITLLPASMGISIAISSILLTGQTFLKKESYRQQIIAGFTRRSYETSQEARRRIFINVIKVVLVAGEAIAAIGIGSYLIGPLMGHFSWAIHLPFQTKWVVFFEYAALSIPHLGLAIHHYRKGDKALAAFHITAAMLSIIFPICYWNQEMRLHHSFYGLGLMALPFRAARFLGSLVTFDSFLYFISPLRGWFADGIMKNDYDFTNIIEDHFSLFWNAYVAAFLAQWMNHQLSSAPTANKITNNYKVISEDKPINHRRIFC